MIQPIKLGLRVWIAITSILSFLLGWALFSHSGKPAPLIVTQPGISQQSQSQFQAPNLPPVPSIDQLTSGNNSASVQALPSLPQTTSPNFYPRFRSRGS
jgi:hypothetical protein